MAKHAVNRRTMKGRKQRRVKHTLHGNGFIPTENYPMSLQSRLQKAQNMDTMMAADYHKRIKKHRGSK